MPESNQQSRFKVPTELTLGGPGLETITSDNYQLLLERLKLIGIEPIKPPEIADDYPITKKDIMARTEEIGYTATMGSRTWNSLTGHGRYPKILAILKPLDPPTEADLRKIQMVPDWMRGLYLTPDSMSCRGLSRALADDRIRSLRNISDAGHKIVEATVSWAQEQITE